MKTVLIIEDDIHINKIYSEKLRHYNFNVYSAYDGKQGMAIARTKAIDLILLDIILPGSMNGFEFLETADREENLKKIPVIILTNLDTQKDQAKKYSVVKGYLVKAETDLEKLVEAVKKYI